MSPQNMNVLKAFNKLLNQNHYSPSLREIADECGLSSLSTIHKHVKFLILNRYLAKEVNGDASFVKRSIVVTDKGRMAMKVTPSCHSYIFQLQKIAAQVGSSQDDKSLTDGSIQLQIEYMWIALRSAAYRCFAVDDNGFRLDVCELCGASQANHESKIEHTSGCVMRFDPNTKT